tara:strand:+ start:1648 stop:1797 length:150 start_codon:yes stop_codon:yes gene_type:complete
MRKREERESRMKDKNLRNELGGLQKIETENIVARQQFSADCGYRLMEYD